MDTSLFALKAGLLFFWAAWFAIVFLTNLFGALKAAGRLRESWRFASKNYEAVVKAVSIYGAPGRLARFLFAGVLAWQLAACALYGCAFIATVRAGVPDMALVNAAFATGIALWAAFMLADELTLKYGFEQSHELLFIAQLASLLAVHWLPS